jgi:acetylornithine deacetylase/succinyl-diaminopimelate desuccinylase-like protein
VFGPACRAGTPGLPAASAGIVVAPGTMLGNTDTRHYWGLTAGGSTVYRHCPTQLDLERVAMFHGRDERIEVGNLARIAAFYAASMLLAAAPAAPHVVAA